jgi:hypothetical protein
VIDRRAFLAGTGAVLLTAPLAAEAWAQEQAKSARLGFVGFGDLADWPRVKVLRAGLRGLGYVEGKNLIIEFRSMEDTRPHPGDRSLLIAKWHLDEIAAYSDPTIDASNLQPPRCGRYSPFENLASARNFSRLI